MAGYIFLGITYGILMVTNNFPFWMPILTATIVYTGSMEFLLVEILQSAFNPVAALVTSLMVGSRHIFYGLAMLSKYKGTGKVKPYLIYALTDETFAIGYPADIPSNFNKTKYYLTFSVLDQLYWISGTALGALFGSLITIPVRGLDFIMTTMFVSIFMNQWMHDSDLLKSMAADQGEKITWKDFLRMHGSELTGVGGSVICLVLFGPDHFIVPSLILVLFALTIFRKHLDPLQSYFEKTSNSLPADSTSEEDTK